MHGEISRLHTLMHVHTCTLSPLFLSASLSFSSPLSLSLSPASPILCVLILDVIWHLLADSFPFIAHGSSYVRWAVEAQIERALTLLPLYKKARLRQAWPVFYVLCNYQNNIDITQTFLGWWFIWLVDWQTKRVYAGGGGVLRQCVLHYVCLQHIS